MHQIKTIFFLNKHLYWEKETKTQILKHFLEEKLDLSRDN